jgi:hypothetical protein
LRFPNSDLKSLRQTPFPPIAAAGFLIEQRENGFPLTFEYLPNNHIRPPIQAGRFGKGPPEPSRFVGLPERAGKQNPAEDQEAHSRSSHDVLLVQKSPCRTASKPTADMGYPIMIDDAKVALSRPESSRHYNKPIVTPV